MEGHHQEWSLLLKLTQHNHSLCSHLAIIIRTVLYVGPHFPSLVLFLFFYAFSHLKLRTRCIFGLAYFILPWLVFWGFSWCHLFVPQKYRNYLICINFRADLFSRTLSARNLTSLWEIFHFCMKLLNIWCIQVVRIKWWNYMPVWKIFLKTFNKQDRMARCIHFLATQNSVTYIHTTLFRNGVPRRKTVVLSGSQLWGGGFWIFLDQFWIF